MRPVSLFAPETDGLKLNTPGFGRRSDSGAGVQAAAVHSIHRYRRIPAMPAVQEHWPFRSTRSRLDWLWGLVDSETGSFAPGNGP